VVFFGFSVVPLASVEKITVPSKPYLFPPPPGRLKLLSGNFNVVARFCPCVVPSPAGFLRDLDPRHFVQGAEFSFLRPRSIAPFRLKPRSLGEGPRFLLFTLCWFRPPGSFPPLRLPFLLPPLEDRPSGNSDPV